MASHRTSRSIRHIGILAVLVLLIGSSPAAWALTRTSTDPSDTPSGPFGKADLRTVTWAVNGSAATVTVSLDESTYGAGQRAEFGVHLLMDTNADGVADAEVVASRNSNGLSVDMGLRSLSGAFSTGTCQDLDGQNLVFSTVVPQVASDLETFSFSFDTSPFPGQLGQFRWAALGQSPTTTSPSGPWDYAPDAANPDPVAANPGDRRCGSALSGVRVNVGAGIDFAPDPPPDPPPNPAPSTCPGHETDPRNQVVGTPGPDSLTGTAGDDVICGLGGGDRITGADGEDTLVGGDGRDRLTGGGGRDSLTGGAGMDVLSGGAGPDALSGGADPDTLTGGSGQDRCHGGSGADTIRGCES